MTVNKTDNRYFIGTVQPDLAASPKQLVRQTFTNSQTWTVPQGVTQVIAVVIGGGGGGGASGIDSSYTAGGGGGGGGIYAVQIPVTPGETMTALIGQGGAGGFTTSFITFSYGGTGGFSSIAYKGQIYQAGGGTPGYSGNTGSVETGYGNRGQTTTYNSFGSFRSSTTLPTTFVGYSFSSYTGNLGGLSPEATWSYANWDYPGGSFYTPRFSQVGGDGAIGDVRSGFRWGGGGNGPTAGGGGGHKNESGGSRGGNSPAATGGAALGQQGGGGSGFVGAGSDAPSNTVGGAGGSGGGGGGGSGSNTNTARGGSGGVGSVLIYY
jgi:hypothetical protein